MVEAASCQSRVDLNKLNENANKGDLNAVVNSCVELYVEATIAY